MGGERHKPKCLGGRARPKLPVQTDQMNKKCGHRKQSHLNAFIHSRVRISPQSSIGCYSGKDSGSSSLGHMTLSAEYAVFFSSVKTVYLGIILNRIKLEINLSTLVCHVVFAKLYNDSC